MDTNNPGRRRGRTWAVASALLLLGVIAVLWFAGHDDAPVPPPPRPVGRLVWVRTDPADAVPEVTHRCAITLRVRGRSGSTRTPLPGAEVVVSMLDDDRKDESAAAPDKSLAIAQGATNGVGECRIESLTAGPCRIRIRAKGFVGYDQVHSIPEGADSQAAIVVELDALACVRGRVVRNLTNPVDRAALHVTVSNTQNRLVTLLHPQDLDSRRSVTQVTGPDGGYVFDVLPPHSRISIQCRHPDLGVTGVDLDPIEPGSVVEQDIRFSEPGSIVGRAPFPRRDGESAMVWAWRVEANGNGTGLVYEQSGQIDRDGSFRIQPITGGPKLISYSRRALGRCCIAFARIDAQEGVVNDVGPLAVVGTELRLVCVVQGAAETTREVDLVLRSIAGPPSQVSSVKVRVDSGVEYVMEGLPFGKLQYDAIVMETGRATADGRYKTVSGEWTLDSNTPTQVITLPLSENAATAGQVNVRFVPPEGSAPDAAELTAYVCDAGRAIRSGRATPGSHQECTIAGVPPGQYQVFAVFGSMTSGPLPLIVEKGRASVVIARTWSAARKVKGRVVDDGGGGISGQRVQVCARDAESGAPIVLNQVRTSEDGSFTIALPPELREVGLHLLLQGGWKCKDPQKGLPDGVGDLCAEFECTRE